MLRPASFFLLLTTTTITHSPTRTSMLRASLRHSTNLLSKPLRPLPSLRFLTTTPIRLNMSDAPYKTGLSSNAPAALGPYSQSTIFNGLVFASGSIPFVPSTMTTIEGGIEAQTQQALDNMLAVLKASGSDRSHVLKTTVFLKDMNDFVKVNGVYEEFFAPYKPARSCVEVARLPKDVGVEVECIAAVIEK